MMVSLYFPLVSPYSSVFTLYMEIFLFFLDLLGFYSSAYFVLSSTLPFPSKMPFLSSLGFSNQQFVGFFFHFMAYSWDTAYPL